MKSTTSSPTVSVVVCTYNGQNFIAEQLNSILAQTYPISEIIVQDDGSTDNTCAIVRQIAQQHPHIKLFQNPENLGFNKNFQTACMRATAQLVAISDQDDVWYPPKIAKQVAAIGNNDICFCCHHRGETLENVRYVTPQYTLEALLFTGFAGHTMLLKRAFVQNPNNWMNYIHYDWSLAINAQLQNGIVRIDEPLNWHRTHQQSAIASEQRKFGKEFNKKLTYQPYLYGLKNYHRYQQKPHWQTLYNYIHTHTSPQHHPVAHQMSGLMLAKGPVALFKLCCLSLQHRQHIYWNGNAKGFMGGVRSFAYPLIFIYNNVQYDL